MNRRWTRARASAADGRHRRLHTAWTAKRLAAASRLPLHQGRPETRKHRSPTGGPGRLLLLPQRRHGRSVQVLQVPLRPRDLSTQLAVSRSSRASRSSRRSCSSPAIHRRFARRAAASGLDVRESVRSWVCLTAGAIWVFDGRLGGDVQVISLARVCSWIGVPRVKDGPWLRSCRGVRGPD